MRGAAERTAHSTRSRMRLLLALVHPLFDPLLRFDNDRTKRHEMRVARAAIIHRDAIKAGRAISHAVRYGLLDMPTK